MPRHAAPAEPMASYPPSSEGIPDPSSRPDSPAVVLACAAADLEIVSETARALRERGHQVEVVSGVQTEPERLSEVVRRYDRQGLYVLCRSAALDRTVIDRLRLVLRNEEVPFGRTLTLAVEAGANAARALEDRIVSVARRMVTGRGDSDPAPASAILPPPPQTKVTRIPQPPGQPAPEEIGARVEQAHARFPVGGRPVAEQDPLDESDVDRWADSLAGRPIVQPESEFDSVDRTSVDQSFDALPLDDLGQPEETEDAPSEAILAYGDATQVGAPPPDPDEEMTLRMKPVGSRGDTEIQRAPAPFSEDVSEMDDTLVSEDNNEPFAVPAAALGAAGTPADAGMQSPIPHAPAMQGAAPSLPSTPSMGGAASPGLVGDEDDIEFGSTNKYLWWAAGGGGALLLIIVLAVALSGSDENGTDDKGDVVAQNEGAEQAKAEVEEASPKDGDADAPEEGAPAGDGDEPDAAAAGDDGKSNDQPPEAAADPAANDQGAGDEEPDDSTDAAQLVDGADENAASDLPPPDPASAEIEDSKLVLQALASRDIRALDTFLVAEGTSKDTTFERAVAYCENLEVEGLSGWRVPTIGELWSLGEAKVVKRGLFWSVTLGDAYGDKRLIYNARKDSIAPVPADWDGAQAVCIRART